MCYITLLQEIIKLSTENETRMKQIVLFVAKLCSRVHKDDRLLVLLLELREILSVNKFMSCLPSFALGKNTLKKIYCVVLKSQIRHAER